jgi:hypothetical protein
MLFADLDRVDRPRESRLVRVRRVTTADEHAARGIHPALDVVVHALAPDDQVFQRPAHPFPLGRYHLGIGGGSHLDVVAATVSHPPATCRQTPPKASGPPRSIRAGEGAGRRVAPELSDPVGPLEVGEHEDVEEFGAGCGTEGVQPLAESALKLVGSHLAGGYAVGPSPTCRRADTSTNIGAQPDVLSVGGPSPLDAPDARRSA